MSTFFGTDGVRGPVFQGLLTPASLARLGLSLGHALKTCHGQVVVGMDTRVSGPLVKSALASGLMAAGMHVMDVGVVSTPCVAFLAQKLDVDCAVMISASHNSYQDNGIKVFGAGGSKLDPAQEKAIEALFHGPLDFCLPNQVGQTTIRPDAVQLYTQHLLSLYRGLNLSGLTIALDCAHGSLSAHGADVFKALGARVHLMGHEPDGVNINAGVGATHPEALQQFMKTHQSDVGFAFDGDGDRVMTFLSEGTLLDGDQMLAILAQAWQQEVKLDPPCVVSTVMANHQLKALLHEKGVALHQSAVGDKYVVQAMEETGALLGGESSGHMILGPLAATGDGLLTALELLRIHTQVKSLAQAFRPCPQILHNVRVTHKQVLNMPEWSDFYQAQMVSYDAHLSCLIRASGTEALVRIMLQGKDVDLLHRVAHVFAGKIKELDNQTEKKV